ncbi:hypothetical protein H4S01_004487, partial [Coemansia sp. RSA 2610]
CCYQHQASVPAAAWRRILRGKGHPEHLHHAAAAGILCQHAATSSEVLYPQSLQQQL